ncbi:MAG: hypothetical protein QOF41_193 [Methylobacteriaceae bacterium]|nr:hypothetical protein [Methylobacteriaceae bacterium]
MRTLMLTGLAAACSLAAIASASAQSYVAAPLYEGRSALTVAPDEEVVVREYIIRRPAASVLVPPAPIPRAPIAYVRPGSFIPADIELEPYDDAPTPALRRYSYFRSPTNQIVLVDPIERRVVRILDRY